MSPMIISDVASTSRFSARTVISIRSTAISISYQVYTAGTLHSLSTAKVSALISDNSFESLFKARMDSTAVNNSDIISMVNGLNFLPAVVAFATPSPTSSPTVNSVAATTSKGLSDLNIALIAILSAFGGLLIFFLVFYCRRKRVVDVEVRPDNYSLSSHDIEEEVQHRLQYYQQRQQFTPPRLPVSAAVQIYQPAISEDSQVTPPSPQQYQNTRPMYT